MEYIASVLGENKSRARVTRAMHNNIVHAAQIAEKLRDQLVSS